MTLPASDLFTEGSPAYDSAGLIGYYIRLVGWTSDSASGYSLTPWQATSNLYSGWFSSPGIPTDLGASSTPAVCTIGSGSGTFRPVGWLWRDDATEDVVVEGTLRYGATGSFPVLMTMVAGVCARVRNSTLTSGGSASGYFSGGDGYYFHEVVDGNTMTRKYQLFRVVSGVPTKLAESSASAVTINAAKKPRTLWMSVQTVAGNVEIKCYRRMVLTTTNGLSETQVIPTYTDSSGSKITGAGRAGLYSSNELIQAVGSSHQAVCWQRFAIAPIGGAYVVEDGFTRTYLAGARTVTGSHSGYSGYDLASAFWGDHHASTSFQSKIGVDTGNNRLLFNSSSTSKTGYYVSQRPPASLENQDRKLTVRFKSGTPGVTPLARACGPVVRLTHTVPGTTPQFGYYAVLYRDDDQPLNNAVYLYRIVSGVSVLLASKTGVTFSLDTDYEIRLKINNSNVPSPVNGYPIIKVYLDSAQVELVSAGVVGILVDSSGTVQDRTSARIQTGNAEGFYVLNPVGSGRHVALDTWALGSGDGEDPSEGEEYEEGSIPVWSETDDVVDTWTFPYEVPVDVNHRLSVVEHPFDSGHRYRMQASHKPRDSWTLTAAVDVDTADDIRDFFDNHSAEVPFYIAHPRTGATTVVCFTSSSVTLERLGIDAVRYTLHVEERFNA